MQTADVFRHATETFEKRLANYPIDTTDMDFTDPAGWHAFAGELVDTYVASHWDLLRDDDAYRNSIGYVYDRYRELRHHTPIPERSDEERREVFMQEGQQLVSHAVSEGIFTCMAVYQVIPSLVRSARLKFPDTSRITARRELLASARVFNVKMSRHSKHGNDLIIKNLQKDTGDFNDSINYETLTFDPSKFRVVARSAGRLTIETAVQSKLSADLSAPFNGCPAFEDGSVACINRIIAGIITSDEILERSS